MVVCNLYIITYPINLAVNIVYVLTSTVFVIFYKPIRNI